MSDAVRKLSRGENYKELQIITDHYNNYINYKNYTIRERKLQELHFTGEGNYTRGN